MFDDQQNNKSNSGTPSNLPVGEPEDIFAGVEKDESLTPSDPSSQEVFSEPPSSALGAGVLKPKEELNTNFPAENNFASEKPLEELPSLGEESAFSTMPQGDVDALSKTNPTRSINSVPPAVNDSALGGRDVYKIKEPTLTKGLARITVAIVVIIILGGGGWWIYNSFIKVGPTSQFEDNTSIIDSNSVFENEELETPEVEILEPNENDVVETTSEIIEPSDYEGLDDFAKDVEDDQILFGEPIDKDADGLDDIRELDVGTDPNNWDSDGDDLSDGDEVIIWKTDPLNPDTDGDTYLDGAEVKGGYNPDGLGKLFEPPSQE